MSVVFVRERVRERKPVFVLSVASAVYGNPPRPHENGNTVDVDSVDDPETLPDDDWGEL